MHPQHLNGIPVAESVEHGRQIFANSPAGKVQYIGSPIPVDEFRAQATPEEQRIIEKYSTNLLIQRIISPTGKPDIRTIETGLPYVTVVGCCRYMGRTYIFLTAERKPGSRYPVTFVPPTGLILPGADCAEVATKEWNEECGAETLSIKIVSDIEGTEEAPGRHQGFRCVVAHATVVHPLVIKPLPELGREYICRMAMPLEVFVASARRGPYMEACCSMALVGVSGVNTWVGNALSYL